MSLASGSKLGPYEIKAPLGAGGMGEVYRAHDSRLGRDVAIKIIPAEYSADSERVRRFEQEARSTAALNHPNIVAVFDIGTSAEGLYVVTELLEGETLRQRLGQGALPTRKAVEYSAQIASGLAAAHEKGIVHRDLKPDNIFITRDGRVKILDFGLAKLAMPVTPDDHTMATEEVKTGAGVVMGTLGYMSPEQVRGGAVDHRADLFSFGAILYEMLSGRRAFRGTSSADTISSILKEDPAELSATGREVSPALERIVRHCLEKNPAERFQSARDLAFDLQSLSGTTSQSAAVAVAKGDGRSKSVRVGAVAVLAAAVLAAAFWAGWWWKPVSSPSFKQLTFRRGTITAARFAPDGQTVIYSAKWESNLHPELFSARTDSVLSRPLEVNDTEVLGISRQGEMALLQGARWGIGWERSGMLSRMPLSGGAPRELLDGVQDADWSGDGAQLVVIRSRPQYQLEFPIGHVLASAPQGWFSYARISPDQKQIAFFEHPPGDDRGQVCVVDLKGHKRVLSDGWSSLAGLAWSATGDEVWFTGSNSGSNRALYGVSLSGKLRPVLRAPGSLLLQDVGSDGRVLLAHEDVRRLIMGVAPGSAEERDFSWLDWSNPRDLTPDGRWLLIDEQGEGGGPKYAIYVRKTDGSPAVRVGDNDAYSISADGKWVLATTNAEGGSLVLLPTGAGEARPIKTGNLPNPVGFFLPDGKHILIYTDESRSYVQTLEGNSQRAVTPAGMANVAAFTADGKYVVAQDQQQKWALYAMEGGQPIPLPKLGPDEVPINHTTDNHSFFIRSGERPINIYRFDFLTGARQLVRQIRPADPTGMVTISALLITPDGKYYVYSGPRLIGNLFVVQGLK
jgi:Tol biopolymer transport system component